MPFLVDEALRYLIRAKNEGRLPHSYLVTGPDGSGKRELVQRFFRDVNQTAVAEKHPDYHLVEPESKSRRILVEQVRELEGALRMKSGEGKWKFGVIVDADRLMAQASNAFLKTLEEPPSRSILLLLTAVPGALLETVQSRCIQIQLRTPATPSVDRVSDALLDAVARVSREKPNTLAGSLTLARAFQEWLAAARAQIESEHEERLGRETEAYKQRTDGRWLEREEERLVVLTESRYLKARAASVDRLIEWFSDAIRLRSGAQQIDLEPYRSDIQRFGEKHTVPELMRRYQALVELQENFARNVQETLAIEVAFIAAFGPGRDSVAKQ